MAAHCRQTVRDMMAPTPGSRSRFTEGLNAWKTLVRENVTYRGQFVGRLGTQLAQGTLLGSSMLLLVLNGQLSASGGFIADQGIRIMETVCYQGLQFWRSSVADTAFGATAQPPSRDRYAAVLMASWAGEVALAGAMLGLLAARSASWLTTQRLVLLLGLVRLGRIIVSQSQYAQFDGLRSRLPEQPAQQLLEDHREFMRTADQSIGLMVNIAAGTLMQALPYMVPAPALVGVMIGLSVGSVALGLLSKQPMWPLLDEGIGRPVNGVPARRGNDGRYPDAQQEDEVDPAGASSPAQSPNPRPRTVSTLRRPAHSRRTSSRNDSEGAMTAPGSPQTDGGIDVQAMGRFVKERLQSPSASRTSRGMRRALTEIDQRHHIGAQTPRFLG